ncbi:MAG: 5,10-methylenetetrahydrofolate reductase [Nitrospirae bacterium CG02_land_8_20_14_3_00_44_33]|nr:MAG: 5,10-methylenetetrahydrofolate reductase [Nitrospirae bacterium CG1_02_44_142]PIV42189.1 MAG: 5,10-methylenetetrahydrofolate reductase [Nitrospirae bacterium CG02_land_8_20_14_3_00_44_33]PIV65956.1 MAG: 5,10-methylenetetrahydrofolate reductase [Nitrospirae bacterium CG01_land_8_20_14_3_00_44_22]PIW89630.1 MAG: 5,10-methylenetetrahydrofolate reductase [Nitrospirae bacterium CG_4_8_14_3_um_filter_44_28]PJA82683.1 MAG: 5,10-methylenetetrahydrofolate reductase [Nitrospirae bacterium CG_4_9_
MSFKDILNSGKFAVTAEAGPPKGTDIKDMLHHMELLKGKVDAVNVTDNQSAVMRICSMAVSKIAMEHGLEPIFQMTCRDRNRIGLQSDLLGANILGIKNVLCMTGDHVSAGDHKGAKPVYDVESVQLLKIVDGLNNGKDMSGNELKGSTDFFQGAVVTPEANPIEPQLIKFEKKIRAGAKFFQTQAIYDIEKFRDFMKHARKFPVKILAGFVVLKSAGMANFLNNNVPGIRVPQALIDELKAAGKEKALDTGMNITARHIKQLKEEKICDGVHIMAIGMEDKVPEIMERAGLL